MYDFTLIEAINEKRAELASLHLLNLDDLDIDEALQVGARMKSLSEEIDALEQMNAAGETPEILYHSATMGDLTSIDIGNLIQERHMLYRRAMGLLNRLHDGKATEEPPAKPNWDGCKLEYNGVIVKEYRQHPAGNQRLLLSAFQAVGWPSSIQKPFRRQRTLNETLRAINDTIKGPIRFEAIGNGQCRWVRV